MAARSTPVSSPRVCLPSRSACRPLRAPPARAALRLRTACSAAMAPPYGFLGLGIMGEAMARNLLKLGCGVVVYNRSADKARRGAALRFATGAWTGRAR